MPISHVDDDHPAEHWEKVRRIIEIAIQDAGLIPQPVWQNGEFDVIQARILKNLFENEIVVCDISTRNPNVMLEFGMRLTTKKPTLVVAEAGTPLPFDTSIISTDFYEHNLDYVSTAEFIGRLTKSIKETRTAVSSGAYHSYMEHFRFETVEPATVSITADRLIESRLDEILARVSRVELSLSPPWNTRDFASNDSSNIIPISGGADRTTPNVKAAPHIRIGTKVHHSKFGDGTVVGIEGSKLEVDFDAAGLKRVLNDFVKAIL